MPNLAGDVAHYDVKDPEDLAYLIDRGLIWRGGPKTVQLALRAIIDGDVPRPTMKVPPEVDAYLDKLGIARPTPNPDGAPPAEPEVADDNAS